MLNWPEVMLTHNMVCGDFELSMMVWDASRIHVHFVCITKLPFVCSRPETTTKTLKCRCLALDLPTSPLASQGQTLCIASAKQQKAGSARKTKFRPRVRDGKWPYGWYPM